jgi:hypothetical protein
LLYYNDRRIKGNTIVYHYYQLSLKKYIISMMKLLNVKIESNKNNDFDIFSDRIRSYLINYFYNNRINYMTLEITYTNSNCFASLLELLTQLCILLVISIKLSFRYDKHRRFSYIYAVFYNCPATLLLGVAAGQWVLRFHAQIKLTATIWLKYCWK